MDYLLCRGNIELHIPNLVTDVFRRNALISEFIAPVVRYVPLDQRQKKYEIFSLMVVRSCCQRV